MAPEMRGESTPHFFARISDEQRHRGLVHRAVTWGAAGFRIMHAMPPNTGGVLALRYGFGMFADSRQHVFITSEQEILCQYQVFVTPVPRDIPATEVCVRLRPVDFVQVVVDVFDVFVFARG